MEQDIPKCVLVFAGISVVTYVFAASLLQYAYGDVVGTLTMIESDKQRMYLDAETPTDSKEPSDSSDTDEKALLIERQGVLVKQRMITSSICSASRHLRERAGPFSRLRGFGVYLVYQLSAAYFSIVLSNTILDISKPSTPFVAGFFANIIVSSTIMVWTHVVISEPSSKLWFRRMREVGFKTRVKVIPATAIWAFAQQLHVYLPFTLYRSLNIDINDLKLDKAGALKLAAVPLLAMALWVLVVVPARVALTRVQASLLPDSYQSIVPFDRSFGGKVVSEANGGTGILRFVDAWKSFDWHARRRLLKVYLSVIAIQVGLAIAFVTVYLAGCTLLFKFTGHFETRWEVVTLPDA
ncbi:MAG: hypothetical protein M1825_001594 [Sarcosagium campestre]|nr:MAG: hypothetical protein M1825_001594 [Sarcosagium campestre]